MFPTRKRIVHVHVNGNVIRTTADHPFYVAGQGWTDAGEVQQGDKLRTLDGSNVPIDAISEGEQAIVHQMDAGVPPFPCTGLMQAGTMIETADGLEKIEDVKPGDYIMVRNHLEIRKRGQVHLLTKESQLALSCPGRLGSSRGQGNKGKMNLTPILFGTILAIVDCFGKKEDAAGH